MGAACLGKDEIARQSLDVMKGALKRFKEKVESEMKKLQSYKEGPTRSLKRIQVVKKTINSLYEEVGNFFDHFKQEKTPANFIFSINTIQQLLDNIWKDHNNSLSSVQKLQKDVEYWRNQAKDVKQSVESSRQSINIRPQNDIKQNNAYEADLIAKIESLNIQIGTLKRIIRENEQTSAQNQIRFKKELDKLISQNEKQVKDIDELTLQLGITKSQLTDKGISSQKIDKYQKRIAAHEAKFAELQKQMQDKALKQETLNKKIKKLEEEKANLEKKIKELQTTPTPDQFNFYSPDEQLRADNQSLKNRLKSTKDELARLKQQMQNQTPNGNTPFSKPSEIDSLAMKKAQEEIQQLKSSKQKLEEQIRQNERTISDLQSEISTLKHEINSLNGMKGAYELKLNQNKELIASLKAKNESQAAVRISSQTSDARFGQELLKKNQQINLLETQLRSKEEEHEHNHMELQSMTFRVKQLQNDLKKAKDNLSEANRTRISYEKQIQSLKSSLSLKESELSQLNNQLRTLREEIDTINYQWESRIRQEQIKIRQNQQAQRKLLIELKNCKSIIEKQQNDQTQTQQASRNYEQIQVKLSKLENQNLSLRKTLQDSLNTSKRDKQAIQDTFKTKQAQIQKRFDQQKSNLLQQIQSLKRGHDSKNQQLYQLSQSFKQKCSEVQMLKYQKLTPSVCYTQYFCGHILNYNTQQYTRWFVENLQKCVRRPIKATYPVYRFDRDNKTPFHNYIDNKPQIVLIVRMSNGQIIAGYSEPPFKPKSNVDFRTGFMFAFKNKKIFTVKKEPTTKFNKTQPKPITYDEFFLMWGNSDIRIKSGTNELYSGYATANCCYEERGNENSVVDDLFLQEDRETTLEDYELFQVEFENDRFERY